jgi:hydroxymethylglutaryl-CoA lyase
MGDSTEVMRGITRNDAVTYSALTPNLKGLEAAIEAGVKEVAIFGAATDSFSMRNINCNVMDSFERFKPLMDAAKAHNVRVRGYVSCVLGCPYEGFVAPDAVGFVAASLLQMGCYEISLGDTIGVGHPLSTKAMLAAVKQHGVPVHAMAVHFHNTYGAAMANLLAALEEGIAVVDASVAGLGGCPYAKGASGNVPTEDVVYTLHGMGIRTGVDLDALVRIGDWMCQGPLQGRANQSKVASARAPQLRQMDADAAAGPAAGAPADKAADKDASARAVALCWPQLPQQFVQQPPAQMQGEAIQYVAKSQAGR